MAVAVKSQQKKKAILVGLILNSHKMSAEIMGYFDKMLLVGI